jgi:hypothetical protein
MDATHDGLVSVIDDLNDDEQYDLIALIWLGRGDFSLGEWNAARRSAHDIGRKRTPRYVSEIPFVSDYLEEGLSLFDRTINDYLDRQ